jgi:vacuolar-type H+-ATPase subunit I/STV1
MPIEAKDLLNYAGIDPDKFDKIEDAKAAFDEGFVKKDKIKDLIIAQPELADPIIGKRMSILERKAFSLFESAGIEFDKDSFKGKKLEEVFEAVTPKVGEHFTTLKKSAESGSDDKVKEILKQKEQIESKYKDTESLLNSLKQEHETFKTTVIEEKRKTKKDAYVKEAFSVLEFSPEVDELKKKGFEAIVSQAYKVELDDKDEPFVVDSATNQRVKNPEKSGEFMGLKELLLEAGKKHDVLKKAGYAGKPHVFTPTQQPTNQPDRSRRRLNLPGAH